MSTRLLVSLLAIAIAWVSLFSLELQPRDLIQGGGDHPVASHQPAPGSGSITDHHLDDLPLQAADSAVDLPDHQPISRHAAALMVPPVLAPWSSGPPCATVFLDGPLRPPISVPLQA